MKHRGRALWHRVFVVAEILEPLFQKSSQPPLSFEVRGRPCKFVRGAWVLTVILAYPVDHFLGDLVGLHPFQSGRIDFFGQFFSILGIEAPFPSERLPF